MGSWDVQLPPTFDLRVNGTKVQDDVGRMITSVKYSDMTDSADTLELTIEDPTLAIVDAKVFAEGNFVDLFMGYGNQNRFMGRTIIWEPPGVAAPRNGVPTVTILGHSAARWMMESGKKKGGRAIGSAATRRAAADRRNDKETIESLAWDYGFKAQADETQQKRKGFKRKGLSDWDLLRKIAFLNGFRAWVEWIPEGLSGQWNLVFLKPGNQPRRPRGATPGLYRFFWGINETTKKNRLLDWSVSFAAASGASEVEVLRYDRKTYNYARYVAKLEAKGQNFQFVGPDATELTKEEITTGSRVLFTTFGRQVHVIRDKPFANDADALEFVKAFLARQSLSFIHLQGTLPGLPDLRKYTTHDFRGLPSRLKGEYEILDVVHEMSRSAGYSCRFSARRAAGVGLDMSAERV